MGRFSFSDSALDAMAAALVCCWKLDEAGGVRADAVSGVHLSPVGTPGSRPGLSGAAAGFSGAAGGGLVRAAEELGPLAVEGAAAEITFSTWLLADSPAYCGVAGFFSEMPGLEPWELVVGGEYRLYANVTTPGMDSAQARSAPITPGSWHHVLFTFDAGGHLRLYLDGALAGTGTTYSGTGGLGRPWAPFTLGCLREYDWETDSFRYAGTWDGAIDETCLWNSVPADPDAFAAALWNGGAGRFLSVDTRQRTAAAARAGLRAPVAHASAARPAARRDLVRAAVPVRAQATRRTVQTGTGAGADARARAAADHAIRSDAEYIVALTRMLSAVRAGVRRDMDAVNCARTVLGLDARARTANAGAAFFSALAERRHAVHGVVFRAGGKGIHTASGSLFDSRGAARAAAGEHPGARERLVQRVPHAAGARETARSSVPVRPSARTLLNALHRVRLATRVPRGIAAPARHDAFVPAGWRLVARDAASGDQIDLGFLPAGADGAGGAIVDAVLPDGDWLIETRPAEWFWSDCRSCAATAVSIRGGRILHTGLPAILSLRGEIARGRRVVRWEVAAALPPRAFRFGIWTGPSSPVDTTGRPLATVPFAPERGSYLYAFAQAAPLHLAVAAFDEGRTGPAAEVFLDWSAAPPASPPNQLAR